MEQNLIEIKNCPVCGGSKFENFLKTKDHFLTKETFSISACADCGFLVTNPRPENFALPDYYESEEYISHSNVNRGLVNRLYQFVRNYTLSKKINLVKRYSPQGHALDIGCGTGEFLKKMSQNSFEVTGIEPNENARNFAKETYKVVVFDEYKLDDFEPDKFDIITMWHVLEHVQDLAERIGQLGKLLKKDGTLIVAVPNPLSYDAKFYKSFWAAYDLPRHLYHFRKNDIVKLFEKAKMDVVNIQPMIFDSFYVSLLSEKYKTGSSKYLRPFFIGLFSNLIAHFTTKNYSSLIYIIKHKNA